ncbi:MAG: FAD-dependent oxidoreductase [Gemmatimonadales bacterium]|jgi:3-phenylpropionate/trans-cinnamate dioxygenase ferredoxin reductase subunit
MTRYLIVGGGLAAASAVEGIRELDPDGEIVVTSAERELPYHRPPLSKGYLAGRDQLESVRVHDAVWYRDNRVRYRLGVEAKSVHMGKGSVTLKNGERLPYDRLLVCTGSRARHLNVPGTDVPGFFLLRTLADATALKAVLKPGVKVVLVGASFIGMEVAATARGLGAEVTVLETGPTVYGRFADPALSDFFQRYLESHGITVKTNLRVARIKASGGKVVGVASETGQEYRADVVVAGVGAEPNTGWLATSGFAIDRGGVVVNVRLETNAENVWAAGDIARFPDPVTRQPRRLEHWDNALAQGKQAGRNMAGAGEAYLHQSVFFSDLFDVTINVLGDTDKPDSVETKGDTGLAAPNFTALYTRGHKLVGAVMVNVASANRTAEFDQLQQGIMNGALPEG